MELREFVLPRLEELVETRPLENSVSGAETVGMTSIEPYRFSHAAVNLFSILWAKSNDRETLATLNIYVLSS